MNLCCPHGYAFIPNPDYDYSAYDYDTPFMICSPVKGVKYHPTFWKNGAIATFQKNKDYHLIGPEIQTEVLNPYLFQCPNHGNFLGATFVPEDLGDFHLLTTGRLQGSDLPVLPSQRMGKRRPSRKTRWSWMIKTIKRFVRQIRFEPVTETKTWTSEEFCMIHADPPEYDTEQSNQMQLTYMPCLPEKNNFGN